MIPVTVADLIGATKGKWVWPSEDGAGGDPDTIRISGEVRIDSRECAPGDLFFALVGERADGHDHAGAAHRAGAVAVVAARPIASVPCLVVEDPVTALGMVAAFVLHRLPALVVIGITGSSGKTSTKDLVGELLAGYGPTVCPVGSYNNDLGVPLTVLRADPETRFLVLEMGSRGLGHINRLTKIARPVIGLILNIGTAHLGEFGSPAGIAIAKSELIVSLPTADEGGIAILNADDEATRYLAGRTSAQVWTFGAGETADVRYDAVDVRDAGKPRFRLSAGGRSTEISLGLVGAHQAANAAAAAAVVLAVFAREHPPAQVASVATPERLARIAAGLAGARQRSPWRMELGERPDGVTVLNDAYNANPESMRAALGALIAVAGEGRRTWAVLGGMGELGDRSQSEHRAVGAEVTRHGIDRLVAVGPEALDIYAGAAGRPAEEEGYVHVPDMSAALQLLRSQLRPGDVVLVKASRFVGLDRLAKDLLEDVEPA